MSTDPYSGIDRAYLLAELKATALTEQVRKARDVLGRKGRRCPFPEHEDRKGSFSVTEGKGWKCHGCGRHGEDVVSFRSQLDDSTLDEAIAALAREYNVSRPTPARKPPKEAPRGPRNAQELLDHLLALPDHQGLSESLHKALMREEGAPGRAYLEGRGISEALWIHHGLGYVAPGSRPPAPLGPAWEGCITFPIRAGEHVVNFQGRRITGPDKLNTAGDKWPFGMNALLLEHETPPQVYLCEGPFDALALEEMGKGPAVALLGSEIPAKWWPLFSREYPVVLVLDDDKGEETPRALVRKMRRLGFWQYLHPVGAGNSRYGYQMDPASLWKASGFSASAFDPLLSVDPPLSSALPVFPPRATDLAFDVLMDGPDEDTGKELAGVVAKNTRGLTLTLRYEDGPDLGHYLQFTRQDGRAFSFEVAVDGLAEQSTATSLALYVRHGSDSIDDVYREDGLEINLALMAAIKKLRRGLHLAVAPGLDPALLEGLTGRKTAPLPTKARIPTLVHQHPGTRPKRSVQHHLELLGPQGRTYELVAVNEQEVEREQLALPGLETLTAFDMSLGRAIYALYEQNPGPIIRSTYRELARIMGLNPDSGELTGDLVDGLVRLSGWAWRFDGTDLEGKPQGFLLRLVADYRYGDGKVSIGIPPLTHEILTEGKKGRDWMLVDLEKYRGLSPAGSTLWGLVSAWRAPREWEEDRLAALVSEHQRANARRQTLHKALDALTERGHLYKWERVQGSTTGDVIIRLVKTPAEARARLRRKNERVLNVQITKDH